MRQESEKSSFITNAFSIARRPAGDFLHTNASILHNRKQIRNNKVQ